MVDGLSTLFDNRYLDEDMTFIGQIYIVVIEWGIQLVFLIDSKVSLLTFL